MRGETRNSNCSSLVNGCLGGAGSDELLAAGMNPNIHSSFVLRETLQPDQTEDSKDAWTRCADD